MTVLLSDASLVSELRRLPSREDGLEEMRADGTLAAALALKSTFSLTEAETGAVAMGSGAVSMWERDGSGRGVLVR